MHKKDIQNDKKPVLPGKKFKFLNSGKANKKKSNNKRSVNDCRDI